MVESSDKIHKTKNICSNLLDFNYKIIKNENNTKYYILDNSWRLISDRYTLKSLKLKTINNIHLPEDNLKNCTKEKELMIIH